MPLSNFINDPQIIASQRASVLTSVIVVVFNSHNYLEDCLSSVLRTLPPGAEVICLDNGSTDGSADYIKEHFPDIKLICSSKNLGFAGGSNLAASCAAGKYLVFLNPDTIIEPGALELLLAPFQSQNRVGLTTSQILLMHSPDIVNTCGNEIHIGGLTLCRGAGLKRGSLEEQVYLSAISGAAFAIRRDLFEKLGGFDEAFFTYVEDADLSWRARLAGYECLYIPTSIVFHDYSLRFRPQKIFYQERNRYLMLIKNLQWGSLLVLLPVLLLTEVVTWGFVINHGDRLWLQKLQAYGWIFRNWIQILESRHKTQALRQSSDRNLLAMHTWRLGFEQTGSGLITKLAHLIFGPLFWILKWLIMALIWW